MIFETNLLQKFQDIQVLVPVPKFKEQEGGGNKEISDRHETLSLLSNWQLGLFS